MMDMFTEARKIFEDSIRCQNCQYYKEKSGLCRRLKELCGLEVHFEKDSQCICGKDVKLKTKD